MMKNQFCNFLYNFLSSFFVIIYVKNCTSSSFHNIRLWPLMTKRKFVSLKCSLDQIPCQHYSTFDFFLSYFSILVSSEQFIRIRDIRINDKLWSNHEVEIYQQLSRS